MRRFLIFSPGYKSRLDKGCPVMSESGFKESSTRPVDSADGVDAADVADKAKFSGCCIRLGEGAASTAVAV